MTQRVLALVVALALAMPHGSPRAQQAYQFLTGNELLSICTDGSKFGYCEYYIQGISDALANAKGLGKLQRQGRGCISFPVEATPRQFADLVTRWLPAHPALRHIGAGGLVWGALSEAFPCSAQ